MKTKPDIVYSEAEHLATVAPQAIFWRPIKYFSATIRDGVDDLDTFKAASFVSGNKLTFELRCYYGHPQHTTTLYLSPDTDDNDVQDIIDFIISGMSIPKTAIAWRRGWTFEYGVLEPQISDRLREPEARILALKIAGSRQGRSAPTSYIKKAIPEYTVLSETDTTQSKSRPRERLWQQIVGNVVSHNKSKASIFSMGYAIERENVICLTKNGENYLKSIGFLPSTD